MLSNDMQRLLIEIDSSPFGIYMNDQTVYKHQRAFYRAMSYLEKHGIIEKYYLPPINKTRVILSAKGKMLAALIAPLVKNPCQAMY